MRLFILDFKKSKLLKFFQKHRKCSLTGFWSYYISLESELQDEFNEGTLVVIGQTMKLRIKKMAVRINFTPLIEDQQNGS